MLCIRAHLKTVTTGKTIITQRRLTDNQFFFPPTYFYTLLHFDCDNVNLSNLIGGYTFLSVGTNRFAELKKKELFKKKLVRSIVTVLIFWEFFKFVVKKRKVTKHYRRVHFDFAHYPLSLFPDPNRLFFLNSFRRICIYIFYLSYDDACDLTLYCTMHFFLKYYFFLFNFFFYTNIFCS